MSDADINIIKGSLFTVARVDEQIVAVKWSDSETSHFVSDGTGPATKCYTEREAIGTFMAIAMEAAGGGAATVVSRNQEGGDIRAYL